MPITVSAAAPYLLDQQLAAALLANWLPGHQLKAGQTRLAMRQIISAGEALGVISARSNFPVLQSTMPYQLTVINEAYNAEARRILPANATVQYWNTRSKSKDTLITGLFPSEVFAKMDMNLAGETELLTLPGFGEKTTRRFMLWRQEQPLITDWEQVRTATGLSKAQVEALAAYAFLGSGQIHSSDNSVAEQLHSGGLAALVQLVCNEQIQLAEISAGKPEDVLMLLLATFTQRILQQRSYPRHWQPSTERLRRSSDYLHRFQNLPAVTSIKGVSYLSGSTYLSFIKNLLAAAKQKIYINLFFFHIEGVKSPCTELLNLLIAANNAGVDVKLILGTDLEGDYHNARSVNASAFAELDRAGISYRKSYNEVTNHTKLVVVDDLHVVCGSHNWTVSSFYQYQETSFYVQSAGFNTQVGEQFTQYWNLLAADASERIVALTALEQLNHAERTALTAAGASITSAFLDFTTSAEGIQALAQTSGIQAAKLTALRAGILLMQQYRIAEITAVALVYNGIADAEALKAATDEELEKALNGLANAPAPFKYRQLPGGVAAMLKQLIHS
jgi:phosphatidylserine/phosphatidylglycerophosphate/cardiolipin synthase-like enzyme